jgi:type II secretory pathway pseudopilin PulG
MLIHPHIHHHRADRRLASAVAMQSEATAQGKAVRSGVGAFARMRNGVLVLANEPTSQPRRCRLKRHSAGLTLIELLVVLMVLIAVAGIVLPNVTDLRFEFAGERKSASQIATEKTLIEVRGAILGTDGKKGLWRDLGEREVDLPRTISELFERRVEPPEEEWPATFDPNTRLGWRGPYVMDNGARYDTNDAYGNVDDPAILDGWGRPIVIQGYGTQEIRLVSGGPDRDLDTADDNLQLNLLSN